MASNVATWGVACRPYEDNSFDFITNAVSVDYLTKPLAVFRCLPYASCCHVR